MDTVEDSGLKFFWTATASTLRWGEAVIEVGRAEDVDTSPRVTLASQSLTIIALNSLDTRLLEIARVPVRLNHVSRVNRQRKSRHRVVGCETSRSRLPR